MTTALRPDAAGFQHLLSAAQKTRSIAAEGGYADLLADSEVAGIRLPGMEPWVADDRTLDLLASLVTGERTCDKVLWMNLANMVRRSPGWETALLVRGVRMPDPMEALAQFTEPSGAAS